MKTYYINDLDSYFTLLKEAKILQSNESITSHIFISYLYKKLKLKPFDLYPQGHTKRGPVDYAFLPKNNDLLVIVELKPYGSIGTISDIEKKMSQLKSYMKETPKELKKIGRLNTWTIGAITDLLNIKIVFRNTKWGNKTNEYIITKESFSSFSDMLKSIEFKNLFKSNLKTNYISDKLWKNRSNRYKAIFELYKYHKNDFNEIRDKWKKNLPKSFQKGSLNKIFGKTFRLQFDNELDKRNKFVTKNPMYNDSLISLKSTINKDVCSRLIRKKAEDYFGLKLNEKIKIINHE